MVSVVAKKPLPAKCNANFGILKFRAVGTGGKGPLLLPPPRFWPKLTLMHINS